MSLFVFVLLLVGAVVLLALSFAADSWRPRGFYLAAGLLLGMGVAWLFSFATEVDPYYQMGDVTRWDHAGRGGSQPIVIAAFVMPSVTMLCLAISALGRNRSAFGQFSLFAASGSCFALLAGAFFLATGH